MNVSLLGEMAAELPPRSQTMLVDLRITTATLPLPPTLALAPPSLDSRSPLPHCWLV